MGVSGGHRAGNTHESCVLANTRRYDMRGNGENMNINSVEMVMQPTHTWR